MFDPRSLEIPYGLANEDINTHTHRMFSLLKMCTNVSKVR